MLSAMGHGPESRDRRASRFDAHAIEHVATMLQAFGAPSRLLILIELRHGPRPVAELADAIGMEQSAVSHQLRLLRNLGLVVGNRAGRHIIYTLYDNHVSELLDQAIYHSEHLRLGIPDRSRTAG
jgi:ArsR family transcriptional regulator, nickel/cobalt-responsive transcriptional repressor